MRDRATRADTSHIQQYVGKAYVPLLGAMSDESEAEEAAEAKPVPFTDFCGVPARMAQDLKQMADDMGWTAEDKTYVSMKKACEAKMKAYMKQQADDGEKKKKKKAEVATADGGRKTPVITWGDTHEFSFTGWQDIPDLLHSGVGGSGWGRTAPKLKTGGNLYRGNATTKVFFDTLECMVAQCTLTAEGAKVKIKTGEYDGEDETLAPEPESLSEPVPDPVPEPVSEPAPQAKKGKKKKKEEAAEEEPAKELPIPSIIRGGGRPKKAKNKRKEPPPTVEVTYTKPAAPAPAPEPAPKRSRRATTMK